MLHLGNNSGSLIPSDGAFIFYRRERKERGVFISFLGVLSDLRGGKALTTPNPRALLYY
jgi:hypothetical protein